MLILSLMSRLSTDRIEAGLPTSPEVARQRLCRRILERNPNRFRGHKNLSEGQCYSAILVPLQTLGDPILGQDEAEERGESASEVDSKTVLARCTKRKADMRNNTAEEGHTSHERLDELGKWQLHKLNECGCEGDGWEKIK
ncbi:hypothetical protein DFH09DRAFT_1087575 [Mycena vulgaris]|nr:hypothetical protein DFH09DRAFT_1087575 [Mycena vulgaris]